MDEVVRCRRAAREIVADVEPARLRAVIDGIIEECSMVPAVVAIRCATDGEGQPAPDAVVQRAAAVQLVYEGLRLTRSLVHEDPWAAAEVLGDEGGARRDGGEVVGVDGIDGGDGFEDSDRADAGDDLDGEPVANLDILAADVLVARGFSLLATTEAAPTAVRAVQTFGQNQTLRERSDADAARLDAQLERDALQVAALTGTSLVGESPSQAMLAAVDDLADAANDGQGFPPVEDFLDGGLRPARHASDAATDPAASSMGDP